MEKSKLNDYEKSKKCYLMVAYVVDAIVGCWGFSAVATLRPEELKLKVSNSLEQDLNYVTDFGEVNLFRKRANKKKSYYFSKSNIRVLLSEREGLLQFLALHLGAHNLLLLLYPHRLYQRG